MLLMKFSCINNFSYVIIVTYENKIYTRSKKLNTEKVQIYYIYEGQEFKYDY